MDKNLPRPRLLHVPCEDGSETHALAEAHKLVAMGADPIQTQYVKAAKRLSAAECTTPSGLRVHPNQCVQVLWCGPGTYPLAAALQDLSITLQEGAVLLLHVRVEQLTQAFANWFLTQTGTRHAFMVPGQTSETTRFLLAQFAPTNRRTVHTAEAYLTALQGALPELTMENAPKLPVPVSDQDSMTPHLYSTMMDLGELEGLLQQSPIWQDQQMLAQLRPTPLPIPKPLLPTKPGHLALQIAAGLLNGHEIGYKGRRLLIKGQTTKKVAVFTDEELDGDGNPQVVTRQLESFATVIRALDLKNGTLYDIQ